MNKIKSIQQLVNKAEGSAALLVALPDIRWACGFTGSNALLVVTLDNAFLITDGRYTTQSREEVFDAEIHIADGMLLDYVLEKNLLPNHGSVVLQAESTTIAQHAKLVRRFGDRDWLPRSNLLARLRGVKTPAEIDCIKRAQKITDEVFAGLRHFIKPGQTEQEIAAEIVYQHLVRGASSMSFDPIVASGPNGALPHARPSSRKVETGDLVVLDFGCFVDGYASDMTRTVAIGEPGDEARNVYQVVLNAQQSAVAAASANMKTNELDKVARDVIEAAGFGPYFSHSLGHGVGLEIHEWPRLSVQTNDALPVGTAVTIEPGVYLPGKFGVRIEDIVVLQEGTAEILTGSTKELIVL